MGAIAAKAKLDLAEAALQEARAASGASEKGLLDKAGAALAVAQAAMDDNKTAMAEAAMRDAQTVFDALLGKYARSVLAVGQAETHSAQHAHAAIFAATQAVNRALRWCYEREPVNNQEATESVAEAVAEALNRQEYGDAKWRSKG